MRIHCRLLILFPFSGKLFWTNLVIAINGFKMIVLFIFFLLLIFCSIKHLVVVLLKFIQLIFTHNLKYLKHSELVAHRFNCISKAWFSWLTLVFPHGLFNYQSDILLFCNIFQIISLEFGFDSNFLKYVESV